MIRKTLVIAFLAVGVWAAYEIPEQGREQMRNMITNMCKQNGAEDKANDTVAAVTTFVDCVKTLIDPETIQKEIEEAKPNGALDEVFKKYCAKSPQLKTCIHTMSEAALPCLPTTLREQYSSFKNATDQLLDFVCYKDGDRIALFIAEAGPECFKAKANQIRECAEKLRETVPDVDAAKKLSIQEQCDKFDELSTCVVKALETCTTPTPANMAESLLKFIKKGSPCAKKD